MTKKTQKKLRKALLLISCAALLVCITVGVTVAYLTDSESVKNTFTVGKVGITLDEAKVDYDKEENKWEAKADGSREDVEQQYKILPGVVIDKDPTVTVLKGSEDCYVRAMITITYKEDADKLVKLDWVTGWGEGWNITALNPETTKSEGKITRTYEVRYNDKVLATETEDDDKVLKDIFTTITVPKTLDNADIAKLDGFEINVEAHAIQADGFADANAAWIAFDAE